MAVRHINGHAAYISSSSEIVRCFTCALALRRRDKGKPAARWGRKAHGPLYRREVARLPNGGGVTTHTESPKERAPPPNTHSERGGALARASALHASLFLGRWC